MLLLSIWLVIVTLGVLVINCAEQQRQRRGSSTKKSVEKKHTSSSGTTKTQTSNMKTGTMKTSTMKTGNMQTQNSIDKPQTTMISGADKKSKDEDDDNGEYDNDPRGVASCDRIEIKHIDGKWLHIKDGEILRIES